FHYLRATNQPDSPTALRQIIQKRYASFLPQDTPGLPIFCPGGFAARLLAALTSSAPDPASVEVNTLVAYVAEGDNRLDPKALAQGVMSMFNHIRSDPEDAAPISFESLREPVSWMASDAYQHKTRQDIYG
ncbi:hypothetical protein PTTG_28527, partial [Puccinia triticina 1-1 BBBD Race 1]